MLYKLPDAERAKRMHIGKMKVLDDFVWLWEKFEEDDIWEKIGRTRLHSRREGHGYILGDAILFSFLIERLNRQIAEEYSGRNELKDHTVLIEFARGGEAPYEPALKRFDQKIISRAAIIYVEVSREESLRRNEARYREKLKHSILAHKTPDHDMKRFYRDDDWNNITSGEHNGFVELNGISVPFVTLHNEPEIKDPIGLADRYSPALTKLHQLYSE